MARPNCKLCFESRWILPLTPRAKVPPLWKWHNMTFLMMTLPASTSSKKPQFLRSFSRSFVCFAEVGGVTHPQDFYHGNLRMDLLAKETSKWSSKQNPWFFQGFYYVDLEHLLGGGNFFHPGSLGKMNPFWLYDIFQGGWFNHQPLLGISNPERLRLWNQTRFPAVQAKEALGQFADGSTGLLESEILLLQVGKNPGFRGRWLATEKKHPHDVGGHNKQKKTWRGEFIYIYIYICRGFFVEEMLDWTMGVPNVV